MLASGPLCPFPTTQPQVKRYDFRVAGAKKGAKLDLTFRGSQPEGMTGVEYGGFELTVAGRSRSVAVAIHGRTARGRFVGRYSGVAGEDQSRSSNTIRLRRLGA